MKINILIADDDREIVDSTAIFLKAEGYGIYKAYNGLEALDICLSHDIQLILLDIMMPELDGLETLMRVREKKNIPIILVSAKSQDCDKILGLTAGADDYITKPFNPSELVARVKSQLRRYTQLGAMEPVKSSCISINGLVIDTDAKSVTVDGEEVRLTPIEYKILELLCRNPNRVFSSEQIYQSVWNYDNPVNDNTIAVHIRHIREKIEINPKEPRYLKVVWGIGYKIQGQEVAIMQKIFYASAAKLIAFIICIASFTGCAYITVSSFIGNDMIYMFEDSYLSSHALARPLENAFMELRGILYTNLTPEQMNIDLSEWDYYVNKNGTVYTNIENASYDLFSQSDAAMGLRSDGKNSDGFSNSAAHLANYLYSPYINSYDSDDISENGQNAQPFEICVRMNSGALEKHTYEWNALRDNAVNKFGGICALIILSAAAFVFLLFVMTRTISRPLR